MTSTARPASVVRRHQLATYFGLTFAISWAIWLALILGSLDIQTLPGAVLNVVAIGGPSIAALVLATILGRGDRRHLLAGFSLSRVTVRWMVVALALPLAMMAVAIVGSAAAFGAPSRGLTLGLAGLLLAEFVRVLFLGATSVRRSSRCRSTGPAGTARCPALHPRSAGDRCGAGGRLAC